MSILSVLHQQTDLKANLGKLRYFDPEASDNKYVGPDDFKDSLSYLITL